MKTSAELLLTLDQLARQSKDIRQVAGQNVYDRVAAAAALLADAGWVAKKYGGNADRARQELERRYFPELSLSAPLHKLLVAFRELPDVAAWEVREFDLSRIIGAATRLRNEREAKPKELPRPTKAQLCAVLAKADKAAEEKELAFEAAARAKEEAQETRLRYESAEQKVARLEGELAGLRAEVERLRAENADLRRRLRPRAGRREPATV